ncbi:hypothetical protein [Photobacterium leiognathi]|uniref:hypothetical protein n=1 Tax=Photobacterium leiognathi TaxID=553611 RepID=UPI002980CD49|nr:hypothetical protein [Photobacterium leiognathi]
MSYKNDNKIDVCKIFNERTEQNKQDREREQVEQSVAAIKEIISHTYSKANSYSNVIIAAGYVGFFTLWSGIKKDIPDWAVLTSGALILLSMMIFIGFELYKMISSAVYMRKITTKIQLPTLDTLAEIQHIEQQANLWNAKIWVFTVIPTAISGLLAGLVLLTSFLIKFSSPYLQ